MSVAAKTRFCCPSCGALIEAPSDRAGQEGPCPACAAELIAPEASPGDTPLAEAAPLRLGHGDGAGEAEMDMTPMVDVTFLLLIFFMVTAAFSLQKSLEVPSKPPEDAASQSATLEEMENDPNSIVVHIDQYNTYQVVTAQWEREAPSRQELIVQLREAKRVEPSPSRLVIVWSHDASHERVVAARDAATAAGIEDLQLVPAPENAG